MKRIIYILPVILFLVLSTAAAQIRVRAFPDERVELLGVIMMLSGAPEYNMSIWPEYKRKVEDYFKDFKEHQAVLLTKKYYSDGFSYSAPMFLAVNAAIRNGVFDASEGDQRFEDWPEEKKDNLISAIDDFYRKSEFRTFYKQILPLYDPVVHTFDNCYIPALKLDWLNEYIGTEARDEYTIYVSFLCSRCNYGTAVRGAEGYIPNPVIGIYDYDAFLKGSENAFLTVVGVTMHEFLHPYCNPLIDKNYQEFEAFQSALYASIEEQMSRQAYGTWAFVLHEALVRASVLLFFETNDFDRELAHKTAESDVARGFHWVPQLAELLVKYYQNRELYPDLDSFMPEIVEFYRVLAEQTGL